MMYFLRRQNLKALLYLDALPFGVSLAVAELFFKFRSFLLETLAFLALWCVLSVIYTRVLSLLSKVTPLVPDPGRFLPAYPSDSSGK